MDGALARKIGTAPGIADGDMNVFYEFHKIAQHLQAEKIEYALIGGVAMAFHAEPRFTKDIDILIKEKGLEKMVNILKKEGYFPSSAPWSFRNTGLTLHRFLKIEDGDEMIIDILVSANKHYERIVDNALNAESEGTGIVRLANKKDLIWLKKMRNSKQDQADVEKLDNEEN